MQSCEVSIRCARCDVLLTSREQFVGHMIHGHDMAFEHADALWKSSASGGRKGEGRLQNF